MAGRPESAQDDSLFIGTENDSGAFDWQAFSTIGGCEEANGGIESVHFYE
jgi:hypothetical protein